MRAAGTRWWADDDVRRQSGITPQGVAEIAKRSFEKLRSASWSEPRMRRFQITISDLMIATLVSALVIASMLRPNALWAFVFQTVLLLFILALIVRGLIYSNGNYAIRGLFIGVAGMLGLSVFVVSYAIIGHASGTKWTFSDVPMIFFLGLAVVPWFGAGIGWLFPRTAGVRGEFKER